MHNIFKPLIYSFLLATVITACEKEESKIYFEGGTAPVLATSTSVVRLEPGEESNVAITFSWTNPNYKFTTGNSSHDVSYLLEIDTAGASFASSRKQAISVSKNLSFTYTVGELNALLGNTMLLQLNPRRTYNLEARITSSLAGATGKLTSNTVAFTAKPFTPPPKVPVPSAGTLWITGDAVASNWANPLGSFAATHRFTQVSPTEYQLVIDMKATGGVQINSNRRRLE